MAGRCGAGRSQGREAPLAPLVQDFGFGWVGALWSHLRCVFIPCAPEETGNLPGRVMVPETATVDRSPCLKALRKILLPSHLTWSTDLGRMNTSNGAAKRNCCRAGV